MQMDSWQELANPRDLTKIFQTPEYAALALAARVGRLALHRPAHAALPGARCPTARRPNPVEEFDFEEDTAGGDNSKYAWANCGLRDGDQHQPLVQALRLVLAHPRHRDRGGAVEGLPTHTFPTDDGGVDMKCPTEIAISDRREAELAKNGFMPLVHKKNSDFAAFIGAQSLQKPPEYDDPDATANANLAARLPYLFASCRFAHYLKCIVRDKIGSFKERGDMQSGCRTG